MLEQMLDDLHEAVGALDNSESLSTLNIDEDLLDSPTTRRAAVGVGHSGCPSAIPWRRPISPPLAIPWRSKLREAREGMQIPALRVHSFPVFELRQSAHF